MTWPPGKSRHFFPTRPKRLEYSDWPITAAVSEGSDWLRSGSYGLALALKLGPNLNLMGQRAGRRGSPNENRALVQKVGWLKPGK